MSIEGIHAITRKFTARWLNPLQFPGAHRGVDQRLTDLESGRSGQQPGVRGQKSQATPAPGTDAHFDHVMARSSALLDRTAYAAGNVEEASHAARMKRSGDILQNIRNTAAEHRDWSPLPEERHEQAMSRSGELLNRIRESQAKIGPLPDRPAPQPTPAPQRTAQTSLFPKSQAQVSQQQFGPAAKSAPTKAAPGGSTAPKKPRVTQPGLFPKSAVKPPQ